MQSTEEAPGPPAESERLQRKSTTKFNRAKIKIIVENAILKFVFCPDNSGCKKFYKEKIDLKQRGRR